METEIFLLVILLSFIFQYVDATIGMGFGTTLTPVLLMLGFLPLEVVPAVLFGQIAGGGIGALFHYRLGNVNLSADSVDKKVIMVFSIFGIFATIFAIYFALNISEELLKTFIGTIILVVGIVILIKRNRTISFSWKGLIIVAIISAFNKGLSGGGYGPLVTGGQLINGRNSRNSVASTTIAEVLVSIVGFLGYFLYSGTIFWGLAIAISIGSIMAGPLAAYTLNKMNEVNLKTLIGVVVCLLGLLTLAKL